MNRWFRKSIWFVTVWIMSLVARGDTLHADDGLVTYRVTIENLSAQQPLSPPVAATHRKAIRMFSVGAPASVELEAIAEDGNQVPLANLFSGSDKVTQAVDIGAPLTPRGRVVDSFTDTVTFEIEAHPGDRFSLATMLICTNDGFVGLDAVQLPKQGAREFFLDAYDAGTEDNTEWSEDLAEPCSLLGPVALAGDPDGNEDAAVDTQPHQVIRYHANIAGIGELSVDAHRWVDPVVRVTIERVCD
jgi:hypothetical protein